MLRLCPSCPSRFCVPPAAASPTPWSPLGERGLQRRGTLGKKALGAPRAKTATGAGVYANRSGAVTWPGTLVVPGPALCRYVTANNCVPGCWGRHKRACAAGNAPFATQPAGLFWRVCAVGQVSSRRGSGRLPVRSHPSPHLNRFDSRHSAPAIHPRDPLVRKRCTATGPDRWTTSAASRCPPVVLASVCGHLASRQPPPVSSGPAACTQPTRTG